MTIKKLFKGFGRYRVATYCPKHGVEINYFNDKATMAWALESNSTVWKLAKVQSRFLKRDILNLTFGGENVK
jgi:hypothetical protein